jgi:hypothetical protein
MKKNIYLILTCIFFVSCATEAVLIIWDDTISENKISTLQIPWDSSARISVTNYNGVTVNWRATSYGGTTIKIPAGNTLLMCNGASSFEHTKDLPLEYNFLPGQTYILSFNWIRKSGSIVPIEKAVIFIMDENKNEIDRRIYDVKYVE